MSEKPPRELNLMAPALIAAGIGSFLLALTPAFGRYLDVSPVVAQAIVATAALLLLGGGALAMVAHFLGGRR